MRPILVGLLLACAACDAGAHVAPVDGSTPLPFGACPPGPRGCVLPDGDYVPVLAGPYARVLVPANDRYLNDHTLVRDDTGLWHVFGITATAPVDLAGQRQFLHAVAPSLAGPWTEEPDVLALRPDEPSRTSAPFIVRDGSTWRMFYFWNVPDGGRLAHSSDLFDWTRDDGTVVPGGRDPMVFTTADGRVLLYTTWTSTEPDGVHDLVAVFANDSLTDWSHATPLTALRNPDVCPANCWGFYESPFVTEVGGKFYLFTTFTTSDTVTYQRTLVFRSSDPTHFDQPPITELVSHAPELVMSDGQMYITSAGWPDRIGEENRGLKIAPLAWVRVE